MNSLRSTLFASSAVLLFVVAAQTACTASSAGGDCGASTCGACEDGFVPNDRCEGSEWVCACVPGSSNTQAASDGDAAADEGKAAPPWANDGAVSTISCDEKLRRPEITGACAAEDENQPCERGCLSCRCENGAWGPCTTSQACFGDGG